MQPCVNRLREYQFRNSNSHKYSTLWFGTRVLVLYVPRSETEVLDYRVSQKETHDKELEYYAYSVLKIQQFTQVKRQIGYLQLHSVLVFAGSLPQLD